MKQQMRGFSLIELMIVVAIVAIISAIAYPSYERYVRKTKRADAMNTLLETAQRLERCYTSFGSYNNASCSVVSGSSITSEKGNYTIVPTSAASTYSLTATPVAGTTQALDTECATFTLTNTGQKTSTGGGSCW